MRQKGQPLIVVGIILVVFILPCAVAFMVVSAKRNLAQQDSVALDLKTFEDALKYFYAKHGRYPDAPDGIQALVETGFLRPSTKDPWGNDYVYLLQDGWPVILSYGQDGKPGGEGADADISRKVAPRRASPPTAPVSQEPPPPSLPPAGPGTQ